MDTAAKVLIGMAIGTVGVVGVAYAVSRNKRQLGRPGASEKVHPKVPTPKALKATKTKSGGKVTVYSKPDLPIRERLAIIQDLVARGVSGEDLPAMRKLALQVTAHCDARDDKCEARAIYDWVRKNIRYSGDIAPHKLPSGDVDSVDLFQTAKQTADFKGGDCDDHSILVSTLAILNGIQARLRVTSPYKWGQDNFTHIYPVLGLPKNDPKKWVAVDTTLPGDKFGVEYPYAKNLDVMA